VATYVGKVILPTSGVHCSNAFERQVYDYAVLRT